MLQAVRARACFRLKVLVQPQERSMPAPLGCACVASSGLGSMLSSSGHWDCAVLVCCKWQGYTSLPVLAQVAGYTESASSKCQSNPHCALDGIFDCTRPLDM